MITSKVLSRPVLSVVCWSMLALILLGTASAQTPDVDGVEISPARVEQDLSGREFVVPIDVVNHEDDEQRIVLSVSGLGHDLDGTPLFIEPAVATERIELSETEFVLGAGERREINARGSIPEGEPSLYASVIAEFEPPDRPEAEQIATRSRVASLLLFRAPRPWVETAEVVDVSMVPGPTKKAPLTVFAAVEDTGDVHIRPTGRMRILKKGKLLATADLSGQTILPGFARRLTGEWKPKQKPVGRYDLEVEVFNPDASGSGFVTFTQEGEIERPGIKISNLVARDEGGPLVQLALTNTGTLAIVPEVYVTAAENGKEVASQRLDQPQMTPGDSNVLEWRPDLAPGTYAINAEVKLEEVLLDRAVTGLKLAEEEGLPLWVFLVAGGVLLLLIALLLFFRRRKKKDIAGTKSDETGPTEGA